MGLAFYTSTDSGATTPEAMRIAHNGFVGIGDTSPDAFLNIKGTTEQMRLDYDDSNYASFTTGSTGNLTMDLTGTNPEFVFSDGINLNSYLDIDSNSATAFTLGDGSNTYFTFDGSTDASDTLFSLTTASSGITSGTAFSLNADTITTGTAVNFSLDGLTSGTGVLFEHNPGSATTLTGDLFRINIGSNLTVSGNIFTIDDNGSPLFSVSESAITSALPHAFTVAGDTSFAYDMVLTNQTSSKIEAYGPLTIEAGESFENNDLKLQTYGTGEVVVAGGGLSLETGESFSLDSNDSGDSYLTHDSTNDRIRFYVDSTEMFRLDTGGNSSAGSISTSLTDLAEAFPTNDATVTSGDIIVIETTKKSDSPFITKARAENREYIAGKVKNYPG